MIHLTFMIRSFPSASSSPIYELPHFSLGDGEKHAREKYANLISKKNGKIVSFDVAFLLSVALLSFAEFTRVADRKRNA